MTTNTFPQLRFSGFTEELSAKRLGDVFKLFNGYAFKSNDATSGGTRWLKIADVGVRRMTPNAPSFLPKEFSEKHEKFKVRKGDFVVALTRPILSHELKIAKVDDVYDGSLLNQRVGKLMSNENLDYVYQLLQCSHVIFDIENRIDGTDPPNLSPNEIKGIKCRVHSSPEEQQKIADFLSSVDKKISLLKEKHALLAQYKKGVMQKLFKQEIRFKDDNGNAFPEWKVKKGNKLFDAISNKSHDSDLPILAITQEHGAIPRDLINYQVQVTEGSVAGYKVVNKGDFIISLRSFQGGIEYSKYKGICSPAYIILRPSIKINDDFYRYYLKTGNFIQEMKKRLEGIRDGKILSYKYFSEINLPNPCVGEQQKIAEFLLALDKKLDAVNEQIELTQTFKKGLLQQMFV